MTEKLKHKAYWSGELITEDGRKIPIMLLTEDPPMDLNVVEVRVNPQLIEVHPGVNMISVDPGAGR